MQNRAHLAAINAIIDVTTSVRGLRIELDKRQRWCVEVSSGSKPGRYAVATQLHHALVALTFLDDGEQVLLDESGIVLCQTCEGDADLHCPECGGNGVCGTSSLPAGWPEKGLRAAILERYP